MLIEMRYLMVILGIITISISGCGSEDSDPAEPAFVFDSSNLSYFKCATEGKTCLLGSPRYMAFGVNDTFVYKSISARSVTCNIATFGFDPAPGVGKNCYFANYKPIQTEHGQWYNATTTNIAYGAEGTFVFANLVGSFTCDNTTFGGDPAPGITKDCYQPLPDYTVAAEEGGSFIAGENAAVAFGINGRFVFSIKSGTVTCNAKTFGSDPALGFVKSCYRMNGSPLADEGEKYSVADDHCNILYTSGRNGNVLYGSEISGTCNNASFGDPNYGYAKKCYAFCSNSDAVAPSHE